MASSRILAPSAEKVNFSRIIALLIDGGQLALRCQFEHHFPPSCLQNDLRKGKIRKILADMKGRGTLNDIQWNRLYPLRTGPPVSSENFDISLLTCLLRNICRLNPPNTGWDNQPSPGDTSPEADIVRIRLLRNEMQHITAAAFSDLDFQTKWDEIEQVLTRLCSGSPNITASIKKLKYDPWDPDKEKEYQDILQIWMHSDKVLRDRIEDIDQRTSTLEADYKDLCHCVTQEIHNQDIASGRVESEVTSLLEIQASQIQAVEEKVTEIARRPDINPILKNMHAKSVVWMTDIKKHSLKNFTKTRAFHQAVDILKNKGVLILSGGPGEGKTTTAAKVLLHTSTPERCLVVRSPDEWKHVDPLSFDVIFIDNMFGEININIEWFNKWMPYLEDMWAMVREKKTSFIIALREHIFENCKPKLQRAELFKPEFCHRLSSVDLSDEEKARILERYLLNRNRLVSKDFINECVRNHSGLLGFPTCAQLFATNDYLYSERGPEFFKKPLNFLEKCLETLYGDKEEEFLPFALLWIMHNRNKKVTRKWLSSASSRSVLESLDLPGVKSRSLEKSYSDHSVHGGFITYSKVDGSYDFGHAAVKDIVGMIVMRKYPIIALKECYFEFILEYVCVSERASAELKYRVEPWLHSCLADRFIEHATVSIAIGRYKHSDADEVFGWLGHENMKDIAFIVKFVKKLKKRGKVNEIFGFSSRVFQMVYNWETMFKNISIFTYALCCPPLSSYREIENVINVEFALQIIHLGILDDVSNKEFIASQKSIALLFGLHSRKLPGVKKIIESGIVVDSNCLCMAVYQSYIDIVRIFIEELKVDINGKAEMMNESTALCIAAKTGNMNMVRYLVK